MLAVNKCPLIDQPQTLLTSARAIEAILNIILVITRLTQSLVLSINLVDRLGL